MKILDWFIEKTPKYRQLLYDAKMNYAYVDYYKKSCENTQKAYIELNDLFDRLRKINHELAEEHKTIGQDLYAEIKDYRKENENLKQQLEIDKNQINYFIEENEKQKEQIKQLEDFIKSDGEIDHINHEYTYKLKHTLQEIKALANTRFVNGINQEADIYNAQMNRILDLIIETESPDQKESEA